MRQGGCAHRHLALQVLQAGAGLLRQSRATATSDAHGTSSLARCQSVEGGARHVHALLDLGDGDAVVVKA
jgi:hypothetical protein